MLHAVKALRCSLQASICFFDAFHWPRNMCCEPSEMFAKYEIVVDIRGMHT
jgi:hypothetical protein